MDREREIIRIMLDTLTGGAAPGRPYFSTDAERFRFAGREFLFTTDEFSEEDLFRDHDLSLLGWNLAAATISDIYASGGVPLFFGHSISVPPAWGNAEIRALSEGIAGCLQQSGVAFIGGDLGFSGRWHYTGIVIGEARQPVTRMGALAGDRIYITGTIGNGNLEAALKLYASHPALTNLPEDFMVRFPLRKSESDLVRKFAHCCIDTSDGVLKALQTIADLNGTGFVVRDLPYAPGGLLATRLLGMPKELLFMGESGEYELLFTVAPEVEHDLLQEAAQKQLILHRIGNITGTSDALLEDNSQTTDLQKFRFSARDFPNVETYLGTMIKALRDENPA